MPSQPSPLQGEGDLTIRHQLRDEFTARARAQTLLQFAGVIDDGVRADTELCGDGVAGIALHPMYDDPG